MKIVPFRHIGGHEMIPGMLCWLQRGKGKDRERHIVKVLTITPDQDDVPKNMTYGVAYADGRTEKVPGNLVTSLYLDVPGANEIPEPFRDQVARRIQGVPYKIGAEIFFADQSTVRSLTGHTQTVCIGALVMLGQDETLYVRFRSRLDEETTQTFMFELHLSEGEAVMQHMSIGESYQTIGVDGPQIHDVYNPAWQKITQGAP